VQRSSPQSPSESQALAHTHLVFPAQQKQVVLAPQLCPGVVHEPDAAPPVPLPAVLIPAAPALPAPPPELARPEGAPPELAPAELEDAPPEVAPA
jgi:hypothetical protein